MILALLTFITALAISGVAAFYSIVGLMAIFSGAAMQIAIMGGSLEVGKLVAASWLYHNWNNKFVSKILRAYLFIAVVVLVFITSIGILGFLSKAHLDQVSPSSSNNLVIEQIDKQIAFEEKNINRATNTLDRFDAVLDKYIDMEYVTRGLKERKKQEKERDTLNLIISDANTKIIELNEQKFELEKEVMLVEADVGPLKYIAELVYGDQARDMLDEAVRGLIIIFIFVFDPLAVLLLVSANISFRTRADVKANKKEDAVKKIERKYRALQTRHRNTKKKQKSIKGEKVKTTMTNEQGVRRVVRQVGDVETTTYE